MTTVALAIVNARVWTGDPRRPWADAVLVDGETLAAVGSSAEIRKRARPDARMIDAKGVTVMPAGLVTGGRESSSDMLRAGMQANLVMLDRPLTRLDDDSVREARIVLAIDAGRVVEDAGGSTGPA